MLLIGAPLAHLKLRIILFSNTPRARNQLLSSSNIFKHFFTKNKIEIKKTTLIFSQFKQSRRDAIILEIVILEVGQISFVGQFNNPEGMPLF
jgi:hypothetical protein